MYKLYVTTIYGANGITSQVIEFNTVRDAQIAFESLSKRPNNYVSKLY